MISLFKQLRNVLLPFLLVTCAAQSQSINKKLLDSLLKNGENYKALKEINSLDTLRLKNEDLALFHLYNAKCFTAENKNAKAFLSYLKSKNEYLAIDSLDAAMALNLDIAFFLSTDKNNREKAKTYLDDYLTYALKKKDDLLIGRAYASWGALYMEEKPAESLKLFKKSLYFSEKSHNNNQLGSLYSNLAVLYNEVLQKPDSAIYYIDKSIAIANKTNNEHGLCVNLINKASCYYYKKEYNKALQLLQQAQHLVLSQNEKNIKGFIYEYISLNYSELGNYEKAYENLRKHLEVKNKLNSEEQVVKISEFNIKYETKEKELENVMLKSKVQRNQIITYSVVGFLLIALIIAGLIYNNLLKKKKIAEQDQLIQSQKLEKTLKDRELHDIDLMLKSQEQERQQIANELHDNLGSLLATLRLNFQNISSLQNPADKELFDKTENLLEETYQKVRNISHLKNMGVIGNEGLVVAVKKMAEKMTVINRLQINVIPFGLTERLSNSIEVTVFRIIQELCTNIIKHSEADEVTIYLTQQNPDLINIIIEDNGKGFDYKIVTKKDGIGLKSIEKKVEQMGGTFTVDSAVSKGTTIIIDLPL